MATRHRRHPAPDHSDWNNLQRQLGVTRIARVTGLDRAGVEVACAVRPRGHVLQVSNGKGESFEQAALGALLEAAELWAAETVDPTQLIWGSLEELSGRLSDEIWGADVLGSAGRLVAPQLWSPQTRIAWKLGVELFSESPVLVPAQAVLCPPSGSPPLGPALVAWTSNGMGAHPDRNAAIRHALLEAIERDQLSRALPEGWTERELSARLIDPASLSRHAPRVATWVERLTQARLTPYLFDLRPRGRVAIGLPVAGALLIDEWEGPVPLTAGYACALDPEEALLGALFEAAQSRLTDIHGAREDVAPAEREATEWLRQTCRGARPRLDASALGQGASARGLSDQESVRRILESLSKAGRRQAAIIELAPMDLGIHVAKAIVPGLAVSELL
jgi:ribosomal protein S12 methylthiotransferase accessory factor